MGFFFFLVLTIFLLPVAHVKTVIFGAPIYYPEWAVLGALIFFTLYVNKNRVRIQAGKYDTFLILGLVLFLGGALLSFLTNPTSLTGLGLLKSWFLFPLAFGLMVTARLFFYPDERRIFFLSWFLMLVLVAIRSLWLFHVGDMTYDDRLKGDYSSPNFLAYFLAPAPLIGYYLLRENGENRRNWLQFFGTCILIGVTLMVIYLTRSYSVWLALLVAYFVLFWGSYKTSNSILQRILFCILPILLIGMFFWSDQGSAKWHDLVVLDTRSSLASRLMIWQSAARILEDHAVLGIGVGRFQAEYLAYQPFFPPYLEWAVPEPHNFLLALFLSTGLMGGIGFLMFLFRWGLLFFRRPPYQEQRKEQEGYLVLALWTLFLVYGLADTPYFKTDLAYTFFLLVALSNGFLFEKKTPPEESVSKRD